jgi:hypothetical protein
MGTQGGAYVSPGWKAGDQASWEERSARARRPGRTNTSAPRAVLSRPARSRSTHVRLDKAVPAGRGPGAGVGRISPGQQAAPAPAPPCRPPAGFVAPAEPGVDENNAQRAKSQPGNNAPMWRAVRETGTQPGVSNLPGAEKGVLIQPFVQYPGSRFTTAGEAWRQVRNNWIIPTVGAAGHCLAGHGPGLLDQGAVRQTGAGHGPRDRTLHAFRARHALGRG